MNKLKLLATLLYLAVCGFALAIGQDPFDLHASNVSLLQMKPIQKEIGVTEAQRAKMNAAAAVYTKEMTALSAEVQKAAAQNHKPPANAKSRADAALAKLNRAVLAQLSATQLKRLREISLQAAGGAAMGDDVVAKRVGLDASQVKKIRAIYDAALKAAAALEQKEMDAALKDIKDKKPKDDAEAKKLIAEAQKRAAAVRQRLAAPTNKLRVDAEVKSMALLSTAQKSAWSALLGKRYDLPK